MQTAAPPDLRDADMIPVSKETILLYVVFCFFSPRFIVVSFDC